MAAKLSPEVMKLVEERIRLHPLGAATDIAASLELDGLRVSPAQIRRLMKRAKPAQQSLGGAFYPERVTP
jgi:hypothetical protein